MKKMIITGVLLFVVTLGVILLYTKNIIGDDMVNILSLIAAALILVLTIGIALKYVYQMKYDKAQGELVPHSWDDIREYNNEIPTGWAVGFIGSILFVLYYLLIGYPTWSFSQIGQYNEEVKAHHAAYNSKWENISKDKLKQMGESIYLVQCAACHGILADGLNGKSRNLNEWVREENIVNVILNGSSGMGFVTGAMPAGMASPEDAKAIASYISSAFFASTKTSSPNLVEQGKTAYEMTCAGCHNVDGTGIAGLAPNLTNLVSEILDHGKSSTIGEMPSFKDMLTVQQKNALNEYIYSLQ